MLQITQSCFRSEFSVTPANWNTQRASVTKKWRIFYRYYDNQFRHNKDLWGKMFPIKGMNHVKTLEEKQALTRALIDAEKDLLDNRLWNPVTLQFMGNSALANKNMTLAQALRYALNKTNGVQNVLTDIKSVVNGFLKSAAMMFDENCMLPYSALPVVDVKRKHVKDILENCYRINKNFTDNRYNVYKAYLSKLYRELIDDEVVETNVLTYIRPKQVVQKLKEVLTDREAFLINKYLRENCYTFWRFVQIFFYSDARETELGLVRKEDVNLDTQAFTVTVIKGNKQTQQVKQISNEVWDIWRELLQEANEGDYIFSEGLKPGIRPIRPDQFGRRWNRYVKGQMGIDKDLRSLNHLHLTKVSEAVGIRAAAASRSHTTPVITMTRYDVGHKERLLDEVRNAGVKFGE